MVASAGASAEAASIIGDAAAARGIMSAGLVLPGDHPVNEVVSALRPNAMVLVVLRDGARRPGSPVGAAGLRELGHEREQSPSARSSG